MLWEWALCDSGAMKDDAFPGTAFSRLARLQQTLVITWGLVLLVWVTWSAPRSFGLCVAGAASGGRALAGLVP